MKKNVYTVQVEFSHGNDYYLPYASGTLIASAQSDSTIREEFEFRQTVFKRENTDVALDKTADPFLVGFSNYIWNSEYNKTLARKIKEKYPGCFIVFGGHNITPDGTLLDSEPYIDLMIFGEGEEVFPRLLLALHRGENLADIPNIAYRDGSEIKTTERVKFTRCDYPSPYLTGVFDPILEENPGTNFFAVMETARGCPYNCAYCDDGAAFCKMRRFPDERIYGELEWLAEHKIYGFGLADSNFGMFARDEEYTDAMVRLKKERGYPCVFQVAYAKESNDRVFSINKKLNEAKMSKGATLSFQSMSSEVQENILRKNISIDSFKSLLAKYNSAGIPTYTELILGLPGETFDSFVEGINILLDAGQHAAIYTHNCEWLPLSGMGDPEYIKKHGIHTVKIPINQPHCILEADEVPEYSHIIVRTNAMSEEDWIKMNLYSVTVQAFHHLGFLMCAAVFLHCTQGIKYSDFYLSLLKFFEDHSGTVGGRAIDKIKKRLEGVTRERNGLVFEDRRFGDVGWPEEEFAAIFCMNELDGFYNEVKPFVSGFFTDKELFEELYNYQMQCIKRPRGSLPGAEDGCFHCEYNFKEYFSDILSGATDPVLKKEPHDYKITKYAPCTDIKEYAKNIVWFGRKTVRKIYLDEIE